MLSVRHQVKILAFYKVPKDSWRFLEVPEASWGLREGSESDQGRFVNLFFWAAQKNFAVLVMLRLFSYYFLIWLSDSLDMTNERKEPNISVSSSRQWLRFTSINNQFKHKNKPHHPSKQMPFHVWYPLIAMPAAISIRHYRVRPSSLDLGLWTKSWYRRHFSVTFITTHRTIFVSHI